MRLMMKGINRFISGLVLVVLAFSFQGVALSQTGWYPLQSGTSNILKSVYFVDSYTGYMTGDGIILKSTNAGNNWLVINDIIGGKSTQFVNANTGYVCDGTIYKTTNGGISWIDFHLTSLNSVYFVNDMTGYAAGKNNLIIKTTTGGNTWQILPVSGPQYKLNSICFITENIGFAAGGKSNSPHYGVILKTTNGGLNWNLVFNDAQEIDFRGMDFVNSTTGYLVGGNEEESNGVIYKTTNAGETWIQQGIVNKDLNAVYFPNPLIGYAVGEDGMILKTIDGSTVWNTQVSNTTEDINTVFFIRETIGFTAGNSGAAQKTVNGGIQGPPYGISGKVSYPTGVTVANGVVKALRYNWETNTIDVVDQTQILSDGTYILPNVPRDSVDIMAFPNDEDEESPAPPKFVPCYYSGTGNLPVINWSNSVTLYPTGNLFNINISVHPITGSGGQRYIGGGVYTSMPNVNPLPGSIVYAMVGNDFKGFGVAGTGGLYDVNNLASGDYRLICDRFGYRNAERNVTLGTVSLDTINFYLTSISVIGIEPGSGKIPTAFRLGQNYPNPFNPVTKIEADIPKSSMVKVAVYDMLGRELEVLVNELLNAGSYKLTWDASKYSSGIYFYKIISSDFTDTRKMILVK
jgi:photosystem II stability/assembly factor-like uncharacterized protein